MAKKSKSLKNFKAAAAPKISQFNKFAQNVTRAKEKKIEKVNKSF